MIGTAPVTHARDGDIVVFNIGMSMHRPHRVDLWAPVFAAMVRMLAELNRAKAAHDRGDGPDLGFLGAETLFGPKGPWVVEYWTDVDKLLSYAKGPGHLPAWREFNKAARRAPGAVGIWHETFAVPAHGVESFYGNGARVGLATVTGVVPVSRRGARASGRFGTRVGEAPGA